MRRMIKAPNANVFILLMGFIGVSSIMAGTMYLPVFPELLHALETDRMAMKMSLTVFMIGVFWGEAFSGPVADVYGKRTILSLFSLLFMFSSFACAVASDMTFFLVARFVQGFGSSAGIVIVRALVAEDYQRKTYFKVIASIVLLYALAPGFSQVIGSVLGDVFPWRGIYYFLSALGGLSFVIAWFFQYELSPPSGKFRDIFREVWRLSRHFRFIRYVLLSMFSFSSIYAFSALSGFLFRTSFGWSISQYAWVGLAIAAGGAAGALATRYLSARFSLNSLIVPGILLKFIASFVLLLSSLFLDIRGGFVLGCAFAFFFGGGVVMSSSTGEALLLSPKYKGVASSFIGVLIILAVSVATAIVAHIDDTLFNVSLALFVAPVLCTLVYWLMRSEKESS